LIGILLLVWWSVWTPVRVRLLLNDGKPIPQPKSLLFGGTDQ
jgi:hypothetical protein